MQPLYQTPQQLTHKRLGHYSSAYNQFQTSGLKGNSVTYTNMDVSSSQRGKVNEYALIDWVNSFNDPHCLLVSSLNDLKDGNLCLNLTHLGIAFCHLVGFIACSPAD